jgi:hypothetical protein
VFIAGSGPGFRALIGFKPTFGIPITLKSEFPFYK